MTASSSVRRNVRAGVKFHLTDTSLSYMLSIELNSKPQIVHTKSGGLVMASEAQIQANRLNAQKSTGPRTVEGKAVVAQNAVRHGLLAQQVVIRGEDPGEFEFYRDQMLGELAPAGAIRPPPRRRRAGWWRATSPTPGSSTDWACMNGGSSKACTGPWASFRGYGCYASSTNRRPNRRRSPPSRHGMTNCAKQSQFPVTPTPQPPLRPARQGPIRGVLA